MPDNIEKLLELADSNEQSSISHAEREFSDAEPAQKAFAEYKSKILNVEIWNNSSTITEFELFDENGREIKNKPFSENHFLRLSMPGSGKYDWVKIIKINDSANEFILTVTPSHDPTDKDADKAKTSHFFVGESTNNFCLKLNENTVFFYVIGLDEKQNTGETKNALETIRNVVTANVGSYLGVQKTQWVTFCKNFLDSYEFSGKS